jgi:hypothetical protein
MERHRAVRPALLARLRLRPARGSASLASLALASLAWAATAGAQGLGDAAKKADDARRKSPGTAIVITKLPLTEQVLGRYLQARTALAELRQADRRMNSRIDGKRRKAQRYEEIANALAAEPPVVDQLVSFGFTPETYIQVEIALWRGRTFSTKYERQHAINRYQGRDRENIEFVWANMSLVNDLWSRCQGHEQGLKINEGLIPDFY